MPSKTVKSKRKRKLSKVNKKKKVAIPISIVLDEPPQKKARVDDDRNYVYIVMSREELYVYVHYDNRPRERYKTVQGVFNNLNEANKCAIQVFTDLELEIAKTKRSRKQEIIQQCKKYETSDLLIEIEAFNETGKWIERDMMQRTHVWVIKEEILNEYNSKRKRTYNWGTNNYIWH